MKINEIFFSIQGEGSCVGNPAIFILLSGCNLSCEFCDTNHQSFKWYTNPELYNKIFGLSNEYYKNLMTQECVQDLIIVFTGGEPTLQLVEIIDFIRYSNSQNENIFSFPFHLETNGTILSKDLILFDYICFSPKNVKDCKRIIDFLEYNNMYNVDIKIVIDGNGLHSRLVKYATMLMPLTTFNEKKDNEIKKRVWEMCKKYGKIYTPRLHIDLFQNKKGV